MSDDDLVGKILERKYAIRGLIGSGGMGMVYEAENLNLGKLVAIKVLSRSAGTNAIALTRFHQEARTAGAMGHPNVCEVYDIGRLDDGRPYMVMERLTGETLRQMMQRENPMAEDDVALIGAQVFAALSAAHRRGVVHRDVKPENVFLHRPAGDTFVVKVLDFGVAKATKIEGPMRASVSDDPTTASSLTDSGIVMGTPYYMAPEQATGDRVGAACDVYAGCIVLFEALTGRKPFDGASHVEVVTNMLTTIAPRVAAFRPVGAKIDALIHSGLSRAPEERPSAQVMRNELIALLPDSHAVSAQAPLSHLSLAPPPMSSSIKLDERFRQLAAAFGAFSADFSLAQADGEISMEESARLRGELAELERWCRSMREDLGRAATQSDMTTNVVVAVQGVLTPTQVDDAVDTLRKPLG